MSNEQRSEGRHPATWVPTVYFAEGLPFYAVNLLALTFYQKMGVSVTVIALATSLLGLPWTLKPVWSPFMEMYKTKKFWVVLMQLVGGASLAVLALLLPIPGWFQMSLVLFAIIAFASATHDIATDGLYIASLTPADQAAYAGWQGGSYNVARFFSLDGLMVLVGYLTDRFTRAGAAQPLIHAWMIVFGLVGAMLVLLGLYHTRMLPSGGEERASHSVKEVADTFWDVVRTFFLKPNIWLFMVFILLYRTGEGQIVKVGPLFLQAARATGGLGLTPQQFGVIYGTFGTGAFIGGSILGGYFVSWLGLKRALLWLLLALNLPMGAYLYLSIALPTNLTLATIAMSVEMFGYGFGFVGVILLMMQEIAPGKYQMAHYAFANSLMNLGLILPGAVSGKIASVLGYRHFFIWVLISAIPALIMARFLPLTGGKQANDPEAAQV